MFKKILFLLPIFAGLLVSSSAYGASTLSLLSSGNNAYQLQAFGVEGVAGLDLTLSYDPSILSAPRVSQGPLLSGAMVAVNPNNPGTIRISAVTLSPLQGSGLLFTITFTRAAEGQGIRSLVARLIDFRGNPLSSQVQLALAPVSGENTAGTSGIATQSEATSGSGSGTVQSGAVSGGGAVVGLMVAPPSTPPVDQEDRKPTPSVEPAEQKSTGEAASKPTQAETKSDVPQARSMPIYTQESILDRFRGFSGERTMKAYLALFDQEPLIGFRQDPPVVLSDGIRTATVHFISTPEREHTSDLALVGAKLIGAKRDADSTNTWIVTVLPEKGSTNVTLAVTQKNVLMVDALTVAPEINVDLNRSGAVDEADFALFLRERGTAKVPKFDLNGDGVRDFRDDFIFTANYLVARNGSASPKIEKSPAIAAGRSSQNPNKTKK